DCRLPSRSGTAHADIDRAHAVIARLVGGVHRSLLRSERSSFSGTAKAERAGALPRNHLAFVVGDGDDRVVERSLNVRQTKRHILAFFLLELLAFAFFF